jgi:hypothetical protein
MPISPGSEGARGSFDGIKRPIKKVGDFVENRNEKIASEDNLTVSGAMSRMSARAETGGFGGWIADRIAGNSLNPDIAAAQRQRDYMRHQEILTEVYAIDRLDEQELKTRFKRQVEKKDGKRDLNKLTQAQVDVIAKDPLAAAYFKAMAVRGWIENDGDGFEQKMFNSLSKIDQTLAAESRGGGKGRDFLAFSDNPAFVVQGIGDALKADIKNYGGDELKGYLKLAKQAVSRELSITQANTTWEHISEKVKKNIAITPEELWKLKLAGALRITKEMTPAEVERLSSQGGIKYGYVVTASNLKFGESSIFSPDTQKQLNKLRDERDDLDEYREDLVA